MSRNHSRKPIYISTEGFTLIEVIVVLAFIAIIAAMAGPSLKDILRNNQLATQSNDFVAALNLAKAEAVTRGDRVAMCRSINGTSCDTTSGNSRVWESGWLVFYDADADGVYDTASGDEDELIRVYPEFRSGLTLRSGSNMSEYVAFTGQGLAVGNTNLGNDTFNLCDSRGTSSGYTITIIGTGRVSVSKPASACP